MQPRTPPKPKKTKVSTELFISRQGKPDVEQDWPSVSLDCAPVGQNVAGGAPEEIAANPTRRRHHLRVDGVVQR
eukprot:3944464-Amphidinium_carterae.1